MEYHPYSDIFPLLKGARFEQLKTDIRANGLHVDLITYQGKLLDGRNRERACKEVGVTPRYKIAKVENDNEALDLVVSLNRHRRHLTTAELAFAAEKFATFRRANRYRRESTSSKELVGSETRTLAIAAKAVGTSHASAKRARTVRNHGTNADVEDIISRRTTLSKRTKEIEQRERGRKRQSRPQPVARIRHVDAPPIPTLSKQQVDPEFKGSAVDFVDKYGHVQLMTAEQYATMRFSDWASNVKALARYWRTLPELRDVDLNWLRKPKPYDIAKLTEALDALRPAIAKAEAMLTVAVAAAKAVD